MDYRQIYESSTNFGMQLQARPLWTFIAFVKQVPVPFEVNGGHYFKGRDRRRVEKVANDG